MSFREEESQKNCPSRGLGLAAAAIGVGVGAALYYFFSKRPENPTTSGSTTEEWHCEPEHTLSEVIAAGTQAFRERTKTNEHCSICFEMMAPDQECMALPCSHLFHNTCILPWLQEQQTCPNCRERIY